MGGLRTKSDASDTLFSKAIRERDDWTCQRCGKQYQDEYPQNKGLHCSHFIGRGHKSTRFHPDNCDALCWGCHQYMETKKGTEYRDWKIEQLGEKRFKELEQLGRSTVQYGAYEKREMRAYLKANGLDGLVEFQQKMWGKLLTPPHNKV